MDPATDPAANINRLQAACAAAFRLPAELVKGSL